MHTDNNITGVTLLRRPISSDGLLSINNCNQLDSTFDYWRYVNISFIDIDINQLIDRLEC